MSKTFEEADLKTDFWGNTFPTAGDRFQNSEKLLDLVKHMAFPTFESEPHSTARTYEPFTFIHDENYNSYVSIQRVPTGVSIHDTNYWVEWEVKDSVIQTIINENNKKFVVSVEESTLKISTNTADAVRIDSTRLIIRK